MMDNNTAAAPAVLDLFSLPLSGSALIEASAGTGKTYTIAALYLRAVLGHQGVADVQHHEKIHNADTRLPSLLPPHILVVTFTEAATGELTERIRARLSHAARYFRREVTDADPLLLQLAQSFAEALWPQCAMQLELACQWMDQAAISTIHSWCHRMLAEYAFDSGSSFSEELSTDQSALQNEVVEDYWRSFVYALGQEHYFRYQQCFATPAALLQALRVVWNDNAWPLQQAPQQLIADEQLERKTTLARLKAPWAQWLVELPLLFAKAREAKQLNGTKLRHDYLQNWLGALAAWANTPDAIKPELSESGWNRLTPEGIADACKGEPLQHPAFAAVQALRAELTALADCQESLRQHALAWCQQRFANAQQQQGVFGFDDLLSRFAKALKSDRGAQLAERVRAQFPLALIDEFQDTDPVQYQIFSDIYQPLQNRQDCALLLIGDPKQAIYAFRGADIYTYLSAKQATAPRHYSLDTNFRSSNAMVEVVNELFLLPEQRAEGDGAFLFRPQQNLVAFHPVKANGRKEQLVLDKEKLPALQLCYLDDSGKTFSKSNYLQQMAQSCAGQICLLLNAGQAKRAGFWLEQQQQLQPLLPADIAVLVNNQQEADEIRRALLAHGIRSVYLSDKGSVFHTAIAKDLLLWLEACAEPRHELKLRSALAADSLGWSYSKLAQLQQDEWFFEQWQDKFIAFHQQWRSQGILPLVRRLLAEFALVQRFATLKDGERQLTDLLHLAELLQQASRKLDGEMALLRYFKDHLAGELELDADAMKLRLESDEALVRVVTIHKSKGLEYPLVFLPFIAAARPLDASRLPYRYHNDAGELQLCYQEDEAIFAKAERERLGEDLRKLYVALTRARHYCWLGLAPLKESSAIAYLLDAGALLPAGSLKDLLGRWNHPAISAEAWQAPVAGLRFDDQQQQQSLPEQPYARMAKRSYLPWWTASYSALAADAGTASDHLLLPATGDGVDKAKNAELYQELAKEQLPQVVTTELFAPESKLVAENHSGQLQKVTPDIPLVNPEDARAADISQQFLRGASAGTFLHDVLEWAANTGFAQVLQQPDLLTQQLQSACQSQHWLWQDSRSGRWQRRLLVTDTLEQPEFDTAEAALAPLQQWLIHLLQARWLCDGQTVALCALAQYQSELEFWFAASSVQTKQLDLLLQQYLWPHQPRPALQPQLVNGMLKGFIDLTFCVDGRYHVSDYKSNYIASGDYSMASLQQLMLEKRYDLQAALYGLALHRLLLSRLPGYDIRLHLGQAYYWFLRACPLQTDAVLAADNALIHNNAGVLCCPLPPALILALDALFRGKAVILPEEIL